MANNDNIKISGIITDVLGHRFVIETTEGVRKLADLGPKGSHAFELQVGTEIVADASAKPSELKILRIALKGGKPVEIEHGSKHAHAEPAHALTSVRNAGLEPLGEPRRKPKHFEVLARKGGAFVECHVQFDGTIRRERPLDADGGTWAEAMKSAA